VPAVETVAHLDAVAFLELAGSRVQLEPVLRDAPRGVDTEGARHGDVDKTVAGPSEDGVERDTAASHSSR